MESPGPIPHPEKFLDAWLRHGAEPVTLTDRERNVLAQSAARGGDGAREVEVRDGEEVIGYLLIGPVRSRPEAAPDPLTGLLNRPAIERRFASMAEELAEGESFTVVFLDLDLFKQINDQFGHLAGDQALKGFAGALEKFLAANAPGGAAGRYGGDEFVILLPPQTIGAEELMARFEETLPQNSPWGGRPGFSYGTARCAGGEPFSDVLARADRALYAMKRRR